MVPHYLPSFTNLSHLTDRETLLGQGIFNRDDEVINAVRFQITLAQLAR